jgi:hypothetical protein
MTDSYTSRGARPGQDTKWSSSLHRNRCRTDVFAHDVVMTVLLARGNLGIDDAHIFAGVSRLVRQHDEVDRGIGPLDAQSGDMSIWQDVGGLGLVEVQFARASKRPERLVFAILVTQRSTDLL